MSAHGLQRFCKYNSNDAVDIDLNADHDDNGNETPGLSSSPAHAICHCMFLDKTNIHGLR